MVTTSRPIVTSSLREEVRTEFHNDIASAVLKYKSYRRKCNLFILEFVGSKVIAGQKPILASFLLEHYKNYYADLGGDTDNLQSYTI